MSITLAEIRYGIERLPADLRKDLLEATADDVFAAFEEQALPFDAAAATHYPMIVTCCDRAGFPRVSAESFATCCGTPHGGDTS